MPEIKKINYVPSRIDGLLDRLFDELIKKEPQRVLWLCPNRRLARERTARFAAFLAGKGFKGSLLPAFKTLKDFAVEQYELVNPGFSFLDKLAAAWLVEEINLAEFKKEGLPAGVQPPVPVLMLIEELKAYLSGSYEEIKAQVAEAFEHWFNNFTPALDAGVYERVKHRIDRVLRVFEAYEQAKQQRSLFDEFDAYDLKVPVKGRYQLLVLDSFQDFLPLQERYLQELKKHFNQVIELTPVITLPEESGITLEGISGPVALSIKKYRTPMEEAREVVSQIKGLIDSGVGPESILIIVPEVARVARFFKTLFDEAGVEVNISQGSPLAVTAAGGLLRALADFALDSSTPAGLFSFLFSFSLLADEAEAKKLPGVIDRTNREEWIYHENYPNRLKRKLEEEGCPGTSFILDCAQKIKGASTMEEAASIIEEALFFLLEQARQKKVDVQDIEEIYSLFNSYTRSPLYRFEKDSPFDPHRFKSLLDELLAQPSKKYRGDLASGVQLTGVLESRGQAADFIFLAGFTDGAFPGSPLKAYILPDGLKRELGLPTSEEYLLKQKTDFYRLLSAARYGVFISSYEQEKNEVHMESRFITELKSLKNSGLLKGVVEIDPEKYKERNRSKKTIDIFGVTDIDYEHEWEKERLQKTKLLRVNITDLVKVFDDCPLKLYFAVRGLKVKDYPSIKITNREIGIIFHMAVSSFVRAAAGENELIMNQKAAASWLEGWWKENILQQEAFSSKIAIFYDENRLKNILRNSLITISEILRQADIFKSEEKLQKTISIKGKEEVIFELTGRADIVACSQDNIPASVIDFKFRDTKSDRRRKKEDLFQVFLYEFLISEAADIAGFEPSLNHFIVEAVLLSGEVYKEEFSFAAEETAEFREKFIEALEIIADDRPPEVEKCASGGSCWHKDYCFVNR